MNKVRRFVLKDVEGSKSDLSVKVEGNGLALLIRPKGHGDCCSADGHGSPILMENRGGKPFLIVWADINSEDPTHIIDLSKSAETERVDEEP